MLIEKLRGEVAARGRILTACFLAAVLGFNSLLWARHDLDAGQFFISLSPENIGKKKRVK